jgi:hypothetical protein
VEAGVGLERSRRGKSPAGSTMLLVLDGRDDALGSPVDKVWKLLSTLRGRRSAESVTSV